MARIRMHAAAGFPHLLMALALALGACDGADPTEPVAADPITAVSPAPSFATAFSGGIPFGTFHQPITTLGGSANGLLRVPSPTSVLEDLAAIRARGAKVVLSFSGSQDHFKTASGYFDLAKWKARVDRFRSVNLSQYVNDGTIIGHYLIDEPYDPANFNGQPVEPKVVEEMARYSKQIWPNLATIVRAGPEYLASYSGTYTYLDAAWSQYLYRKGDPREFMSRSVADAQKKGLALIIGFNLLGGGRVSGTSMTATDLESWGSALLSSTYPCAFISWKYDANYMQQAGIQRAMSLLAEKARNRSTRSCLAGGSSDPVAPTPLPSAPPTEDQPIRLSATYWAGETARHYVRITWTGATGPSVDIYREGDYRRTTENDGRGTIVVNPQNRSTFRVKVCESHSTRCSNEILLQYQ